MTRAERSRGRAFVFYCRPCWTLLFRPMVSRIPFCFVFLVIFGRGGIQLTSVCLIVVLFVSSMTFSSRTSMCLRSTLRM